MFSLFSESRDTSSFVLSLSYDLNTRNYFYIVSSGFKSRIYSIAHLYSAAEDKDYFYIYQQESDNYHCYNIARASDNGVTATSLNLNGYLRLCFPANT